MFVRSSGPLVTDDLVFYCLQVRRLPVGDGIWIARHKYLGSEYVLDFIVERKKIDDLRHSIRDNRYRDQKMRLVVIFSFYILLIKACFFFLSVDAFMNLK